jgi:hypothetical protein
MPDRLELLRSAAQQRLNDIGSLYRQQCVQVGLETNSSLVSGGAALLQDISALAAFPQLPAESAGWLQCQYGSCADGLSALALGQALEPGALTEKPPAGEVTGLRRMDASHRLDVLSRRYLCPLNIAREPEVGEELLMQMMTLERRKIEDGELVQFHPEDFLLRLNLIAICAIVFRDLRYLDAVNFVYEHLPRSWNLGGRAAAMYASGLLLYARALALLRQGGFQ